jgi:hypothetical protein
MSDSGEQPGSEPIRFGQLFGPDRFCGKAFGLPGACRSCGELVEEAQVGSEQLWAVENQLLAIAGWDCQHRAGTWGWTGDGEQPPAGGGGFGQGGSVHRQGVANVGQQCCERAVGDRLCADTGK